MIEIPKNCEAVSWFVYDCYDEGPAWKEQCFFMRSSGEVGINATNMDLSGGQFPQGNIFYVQGLTFDLKIKKKPDSLFLRFDVSDKRCYNAKIMPYMITNGVVEIELPQPVEIIGHRRFRVVLENETPIRAVSAAMAGILIRPTC